MQVFIAWKEEFFWSLTVAPNTKAVCGKGLPWRLLRGGTVGTIPPGLFRVSHRHKLSTEEAALKLSYGCTRLAVRELLLPTPRAAHPSTPALWVGWCTPPLSCWETSAVPCAGSPAKKVKSILQGSVFEAEPSKAHHNSHPAGGSGHVLLQQALNSLMLLHRVFPTTSHSPFSPYY